MSGMGHPFTRWEEAEEPATPVALKLCRSCEVVCVADLERCWNCGTLLAGERTEPAPAAKVNTSGGAPPPWLLEASLIWQGRDERAVSPTAQVGGDRQAAPAATTLPGGSSPLRAAPPTSSGLFAQAATYPPPTGERWNAGVITSLAVVLGTVAIVGIDQFSLGVSNGFAPASTAQPGQETLRADVVAPPVAQAQSPQSDAILAKPEAAPAPVAAPAAVPEVALREIPDPPPVRLDAGRIATAGPALRTADLVVPDNGSAARPRSGKLVYQENCASCHDAGKMNSPSVHDMDAWTERLARGKHSLYASVTAGKGSGRHAAQTRALADDELIAATDYLTERLIDLSVARASRAGFSILYGPGGALPVSTGGEGLREATLKSD